MVKLRLVDAIISIALIALVLSHFDVDSLLATADLEIITFSVLGLPVIVAKIIRGASHSASLTTGRIFVYLVVILLSIIICISKFQNGVSLITNQGFWRSEARSQTLISLCVLQCLLFDFIAFDMEFRRIRCSEARRIKRVGG